MLCEPFNRSAVDSLVFLKVPGVPTAATGCTEMLYWNAAYDLTWLTLRVHFHTSHPVTMCMKERSSYATTICPRKVQLLKDAFLCFIILAGANVASFCYPRIQLIDNTII